MVSVQTLNLKPCRLNVQEYGDDELNEITRVAVAALPSVDGKAPGAALAFQCRSA